ncbi:TetR/AcrR family transcriptional regulator [Frondihabitans sp. VKM Ac-2883]|uniref:TetR/AcrR family transcriptional regulator n=1 Tax=Frondihabitans sp. VKM Ac-2883 TaxID=2783823 RepID=UPI00188AB9E3|nr:TetR/AcrR family transcriptional regulator [Frondihabitans sp. VKM Ac-2883]MBF4576755.1 TetR/AcrR family transcriptional regulator [Frondihabitans sp. VKM Ac-2883]
MTHVDPAPVKLGRKRDHSRDPEILQAAIDVLAETGYDRMTIEMVATRAKAGKATLYRRWSSKSELVIDAIACMKRGTTPDVLPDTGTLRGDLVAMIKPHSIEDNEKKLKVMAGIVALLAHSPEMSAAVNSAIVEPRVEINRRLLQRAVDRGEISGDCNIDELALISPSMVAYRTLILKQPVDRDFLVGLIDGVVLPAVGLRLPESEPEAVVRVALATSQTQLHD